MNHWPNPAYDVHTTRHQRIPPPITRAARNLPVVLPHKPPQKKKLCLITTTTSNRWRARGHSNRTRRSPHNRTHRARSAAHTIGRINAHSTSRSVTEEHHTAPLIQGASPRLFQPRRRAMRYSGRERNHRNRRCGRTRQPANNARKQWPANAHAPL